MASLGVRLNACICDCRLIRTLLRFIALCAGFGIGWVGICAAQTGPLAISMNSNAAAGSISLNIVLTAPPGTVPVTLQWALNYPDADVVGSSVVVGTAANAAGKTLTCAGKGCVLWGVNNLPVPNGVVAVMTLQLANSASSAVMMELTETSATSTTGDRILQNAGNASLTVNTQPLAFPTSIASSLALTGSAAQVAFAGGWETTFNLINTGTGTANVRTQFFADNGNGLDAVLNLPQSSAPDDWFAASSVDQTLAPGAAIAIVVTGPDSQPARIGSAQLSATGNVSGFARLRYVPTDQETASSLETRNARSYLVAFDNTGGIVTGIAVANLANAAASIPIVIRDDKGAQIGTGSISLPNEGHSAFVLSDQFAATIGQSGTIEFDTPPGGQISMVGMRFLPGGSFSAIPVVASTDLGGGSLAHVAVGNGWTSTVELINSGAMSAQAHLNFYGDDGSPLPIALTVSGTATTSSAVDQTLAPYARLVIQSNGLESAPLQVGSAQLTSDGTVTGFIRFRYEASGREATVPIQPRNAGAYLLVFDNTKGLTSGVAVASGSDSAATVPVVIRNNAGAQIGSGSLALATNGHTSFVLTDVFPATAGQSGTLEFDTPTGGEISVLGMRFAASGAFSTIPVVVP